MADLLGTWEREGRNAHKTEPSLVMSCKWQSTKGELSCMRPSEVLLMVKKSKWHWAQHILAEKHSFYLIYTVHPGQKKKKNKQLGGINCKIGCTISKTRKKKVHLKA